MTAHQVALGAGLFFWSLLGLLPIYLGIRVGQNKVPTFPITGYHPEKAQDVAGLNRWVGTCLLLLGLTLIGSGVLAGTISFFLLIPALVAVSLCTTALEKGAARYYKPVAAD